MIWLRSLIKNNRGQALVEFALLLPVLLLIIGGMIDFGLVYHEQLVMTAAAREGARVAVVNGESKPTAGKTAAETYAKNASINPAGINVDPPDFESKPGTTEKTVTITVTNNVPIVFPMMPAIFASIDSNRFKDNKFLVTGKAIMRVE